MSTRSLTLDMPEELYVHYETQAQADKRKIDDFVLDKLVRQGPPQIENDLPPKLNLELNAMAALSDEVLWLIGDGKMNEDKVALYDVLLERSESGDLTTEGQEMLESLREEADSIMVRKAHALALLQSRGHTIPTIQNLRRRKA